MSEVIKVDGSFRVIVSGEATATTFTTEREAKQEVAHLNERRKEMAVEAGMLHGVDAYNDAMGYDLSAPEECGHHCPPSCICYEEG